MSEWISVEDRLPDDDQVVLICCWMDIERFDEDEREERILEQIEQWNSGCLYQHVATYKERMREWAVGFSNGSLKNSAYVSISFKGFEDGDWPVTHWMPLPEPPK